MENACFVAICDGTTTVAIRLLMLPIRCRCAAEKCSKLRRALLHWQCWSFLAYFALFPCACEGECVRVRVQPYYKFLYISVHVYFGYFKWFVVLNDILTLLYRDGNSNTLQQQQRYKTHSTFPHPFSHQTIQWKQPSICFPLAEINRVAESKWLMMESNIADFYCVCTLYNVRMSVSVRRCIECMCVCVAQSLRRHTWTYTHTHARTHIQCVRIKRHKWTNMATEALRSFVCMYRFLRSCVIVRMDVFDFVCVRLRMFLHVLSHRCVCMWVLLHVPVPVTFTSGRRDSNTRNKHQI